MELDGLVKASLEAQIIKAFRETPEAIDALVQAALSKEVDQYGTKPDYHSREKMPYLSWLARETIQNIARSAVQEHIKAMEPKIRQQVTAALSTELVVDAFTQKILSGINDEWSIRVVFNTGK